jgi:hypothetical protein
MAVICSSTGTEHLFCIDKDPIEFAYKCWAMQRETLKGACKENTYVDRGNIIDIALSYDGTRHKGGRWCGPSH